MTKVISLFWTIFDTLAANQFTRRLITKTSYLGSSRQDVFKGTNLTFG